MLVRALRVYVSETKIIEHGVLILLLGILSRRDQLVVYLFAERKLRIRYNWRKVEVLTLALHSRRILLLLLLVTSEDLWLQGLHAAHFDEGLTRRVGVPHTLRVEM